MNASPAPRNRSLTLTSEELDHYSHRRLHLHAPIALGAGVNRTIQQDSLIALGYLPPQTIDLLFADPPYNLDKTFNSTTFKSISEADYEAWLDQWMSKTKPLLKPTTSIYVCGDWRSSGAIQRVLARYFIVRNRITWEREKGRGAKANWKNCSEDIWFATCSDTHTFNLEAVKIKRRVIAPYTDSEGAPKDWEDSDGGRFRLTHPSNVWTDLTVPFWSMPENTEHPTQKPEKLPARIILASSNADDLVVDPFLGSGTTSVMAKKLGRRFIGIELDQRYGCLAEKRLALAETDKRIQGYEQGIFFERNTPAILAGKS
ncbi:MAG: adenine-specific DNA-methyltransferase [Anaerolineae bacterium]